MFGYVKPYKPEMKVAEFEIYQGVYCGLCKRMGRLYGQISRSFLSYDMTFLALVRLSTSSNPATLKQQPCIAHPLKKRPCLKADEDLSFAAHTAMIMAYFKLKDNIRDSRGFFKKLKCLVVLPFAAYARKSARKQLPEVDKAVNLMMTEQNQIEKSDSPSVDQACDPTAKALGRIAEMLARNEKQRVILQKTGYMLGRYIYLMDALDDLDDDAKTNNFNPYLKKFGLNSPNLQQKREIAEYAQQIINITVSQLAAAYELLETKRFKNILDNIIYIGMKYNRELILKRILKTAKRESTDDRSVSDIGY